MRVTCTDCQADLNPGHQDTMYDCLSGTYRCRDCWRSREAHMRWERHNGWPAAHARQRRIEMALA